MCVRSASTDLCGGCRVTSIPTATPTKNGAGEKLNGRSKVCLMGGQAGWQPVGNLHHEGKSLHHEGSSLHFKKRENDN
ncbi:MAG TPA: hypothetical protein VMO17_13915 [Terriglobia bacterium]|nr:hypothetical protein [Terriglobia bacterium]